MGGVHILKGRIAMLDRLEEGADKDFMMLNRDRQQVLSLAQANPTQ